MDEEKGNKNYFKHLYFGIRQWGKKELIPTMEKDTEYTNIGKEICVLDITDAFTNKGDK